MVPVYICDDNSEICQQILAIVQKQVLILECDLGPVRLLKNPLRLLEIQKENSLPAVYFLDVDFPGYCKGFELASRLRKHDPRGFIIFITAHHELIFETFHYRLEAMDYIVKGDAKKMQQQILSCLVSVKQRLMDEASSQSTYYALKHFDMVHHIPFKNILFFEAIGKTHMIRLHMNDEIMEFYGSLSKVEEELGENFWRCHRGFLANRSRIARICLKEHIIEFDNEKTCPLSRREGLKINSK